MKSTNTSAEDTETAGWTMRVPLANGDYAVLARPFASPVLPMVVAPFVDLLRQTLVEKFPESAAEEERAGGIFGGTVERIILSEIIRSV